MAYKRYIKRGGKVYGPYIQHNKKVDGKVVTEYLGKSKPIEKKRIKKTGFIIGILLLLVLSLILFDFPLTGKVTLLIEENYQLGEQITGSVKLNLKHGEFIPGSTKIIINNAGEEKEFLLKELISWGMVTGNFYVENKEISGAGEGYGVIGEKMIYPEVDFTLSILESFEKEKEKRKESGKSQEKAEEVVEEELEQEQEEIEEKLEEEQEAEEIEEEELEQEEAEEIEEELEQEANEEEIEQETEFLSITGEVISELKKISASVTKQNEFEYELQRGQSAEIVEGSVIVNGEVVDESILDIKLKKDKIVVSTDYSEIRRGFGEQYLEDDVFEISLDLSQLNLTAQEGVLVISLIYGGTEIISAEKTISIEGIEENATINNETLSTGNLTTTQYGAVLNKPVKWKKHIQLDKKGVVRIEVPKQAENITVYKIINEISEEINETVLGGINESESEENIIEAGEIEENVNEGEIIEEEIINESESEIPAIVEGKLEQEEKIKEKKNTQNSKFVREKKKITAKVISGEVSAEIELGSKSSIADFFKKIFSVITGRVIDIEEKEEVKEIVIEENATEFEIEYETPGPVAFEKNTSYGKEIVISSDVHYMNILAYAELPREVPESAVRLYNIVNGTRVLTEFKGYYLELVNNSIEGNLTEYIVKETLGNLTDVLVNDSQVNKSESDFEINKSLEVNNSFEYNKSSERLINYIEWIVPHLSNESYELEIVILNVQSYPTVGGNWTVRFNTTGTADLRISAYNLTTWINKSYYDYLIENNMSESITQDLVYLETRCGEEILEYNWVENNYSYVNCIFNEEINETECVNETIETYSVFIENYSCNLTANHTVKVLTEGVHTQEFDFGGIKAYAHNLATAGGFTTITHTSFDDFYTGSFTNGTYANGSTASDSDGNIKMVVPGEPSDKDASMVLWMHFNNDSSIGENDTHAYDWSGSGNNGTIHLNGTGKVNITGGKFGGAIEFDGEGDYVDLGAIPTSLNSFTDKITVVTWMKSSGVDANVDYERIIDFWHSAGKDGYVLRITNNHASFAFGNNVINYILEGTSDIDDANWHFIVATYNGSVQKIFVDGIEENDDSSATGDISINDVEHFLIGKSQSNTGHFNGTIDEVAIYNRSLSASEIHALFLAGNATRQNITESNWTSPILDAGQTGVNWTSIVWDAVQDSRANVTRTSELDYNEDMVLWMHFNNDSSVGENDTNVYDWSGLGNNGTTSGNPVMNLTGGKFGGAIEFDGEGDYMYVLDNDFLSLNQGNDTPATWSAWIKMNDATNFAIVEKYRASTEREWRLHVSSTDRLSIIIYDVGDDSIYKYYNTTLTSYEGEFVHVAATYDGSKSESGFELYLNGENIVGVAEGATYDGAQNNIGNVYIGGNPWRSVYTNGTIDEVAIWNRSLSAEEIRNLYYEDVVKFQTRTATTSAGIDAATWSDYLRIDGSSQNLDLSNRFLQYRAVFKSNTTDTPILKEVNITYASPPLEPDQGGHFAQLTIWDDSDTSTVYSNYTMIYANYTNASAVTQTINGTGIWCEFRYNKTELGWGLYDAVNMTFNNATKQYELIADGNYLTNHTTNMPVGNYSFNISCFDTTTSFTNLSITDEIVITEYSTGLKIQNDTGKAIGETVYFYANYTRNDIWDVTGWTHGQKLGQVVWNTSDIDISSDTRSIAYFDCENKGKKDCVVVGTYQSDKGLRAFYANGTEIVKSWPGSEPVYAIYEIEVGDLDNDGYENDILMGGVGNIVKVYNESGDRVWNSSAFAGSTFSVVIADLDNDGIKDDFAVAAGTKLIAFNTSDGTTWNNLWNGTGFSNYVAEVAIGDFDRDGDDDVAGVDISGFLRVFVGDNGSLIFDTVDLGSARSVVAVDLDHDGYKDEIIVGEDNDVWAYEWNGTYGATMSNTWRKTGFSGGVYEVAITDLDNDDYEDDIVVGDTGYIWGLDNNSNQLWNFTGPTGTVRSISIGDINSDGVDEIIAGGYDGIVWVLNKSGNLLWGYTIGLGAMGHTYGSSPATDISDINNDGINDIAVASWQGYVHILQDVNCIARFNDSTVYNMTWNATLDKWYVNKTFSSVGSYEWNVTCSKGGYEEQILGGTVNLSSLSIYHTPSSPYANYTKIIANFSESSASCEMRHNATGSWSSWYNMSYDSTNQRFEVIADNGYVQNSTEWHITTMPVGGYSYMVQCNNSLNEVVNATNSITIQEYSTGLIISNSTGSPEVGVEMWLYANYTRNDTWSVSGWDWGQEIGRVVWNTSDLGLITYSMAFFDCENKGKKDCVAVGENNDLWFYYPNGSLLRQATEPTSNLYDVEVGDLDNDGYENEVVIVDNIGIVWVFNETGNAVWNTSDLGINPYSMALGDLDNDGIKDDFVVGVSAGSYKVMAFNTSDGITWTNFWNGTGFANYLAEVAIGDFDRDGDDDVAGVDINGYLRVFVGDNGSLIFNTTDLGDTRSVVAVDLDHDGYKDEIVAGGNGEMWAYEWNGTWGVEYKETTDDYIWRSTEPNFLVYEILIMDLDNDGWEDDIAAADSGTNGAGPGIIFGFNNDSNQLWNFTLPINSILPDEDRIYSMSIGDVNDDGKKEIIFGSEEFDRIYVLNKTGSKLWEYTIGLGNIGTAYGSSPATDISDINNDGINDIAVASENGYAHILQDVKCVAEFNDTTTIYNMTWNATLDKWYVNKTFSSVGSYEWNVTCSKGGYEEQVLAGSTLTAVDTTASDINFTNPTPANDTTTTNTSIEINVSITELNLDELTYNWNGTNFTFFNDSLVLMMNFNNVSALGENDTYAVDVSGNGNDGTTSGNPVMNLTGGKFSGAFEFDGIDDYVEVADSSELGVRQNYTLSMWFKPSHDIDLNTGTKRILEKGDSIFMSFDDSVTGCKTNGELCFFVKTSGVVSCNVNTIGLLIDFEKDVWVNVVIIHNSTSVAIYRDGILENSTSCGLADDDDLPLVIGADDGVTDDFNGSIDEVRIYNRALSAEEIQQLYFTNLNKYDTDKWALYVNQSKNSTDGLDDGSYTYLAYAGDESGNENSTETRSVNIIGAPSGNKLRITNSSNNNVASIDDKGDMYLKGTASQSQGALSPGANSFIVQNSSGDTVSYFNNTGSLFLFGAITRSSDLSGMTSSNLEFRNSTNDLVAFFDNLGNLKLKGYFIENYGSP